MIYAPNAARTLRALHAPSSYLGTRTVRSLSASIGVSRKWSGHCDERGLYSRTILRHNNASLKATPTPMESPMTDLPPEIANRLLALVVTGNDGTVTVPDKAAFMRFVEEYGPKYPLIQGLVKLDEAAVQKYYEETGQVPAGIKGTRVVSRPDSNVTEMQVIYGKDP